MSRYSRGKDRRINLRGVHVETAAWEGQPFQGICHCNGRARIALYIYKRGRRHIKRHATKSKCGFWLVLFLVPIFPLSWFFLGFLLMFLFCMCQPGCMHNFFCFVYRERPFTSHVPEWVCFIASKYFRPASTRNAGNEGLLFIAGTGFGKYVGWTTTAGKRN